MATINAYQKSEIYKTFLKILHCLKITGASTKEEFRLQSSSSRELLSLTPHSLKSPIDIDRRLFAFPSPLPDTKPDTTKIHRLGTLLQEKRAVIRLNHIGFCYKVASQQTEQKLLITEVKKKNWHIYQEPSVTDGLWLFIGDTTHWQNPLLEFIPVEKTKNRWEAYWLPHIQIDLDTLLSEKQAKNLLYSVFGQKIQPYTIAIDGIVYLVNLWLGVINGINFELDLGTDARNTQYARQNILRKLT